MCHKVEFITLEDLRDYEDASLNIDEPPCATIHTVYHDVLPEPSRHRAFEFACVDECGLVLFSSTQGEIASDKYYLVCDL